MSLKLKEKNQIVLSYESLMEDDLIVVDELVLLVLTLQRCLWWLPFIFNKI
jgi:hypothetical protein